MSYSKVNKAGMRYSTSRAMCECGNPATIVKSGHKVCDRCSKLNEIVGWHKETCGYRNAQDFYRVAIR